MIKAAIFDVDGVLLDSMSIWNDAGAKYLTAIHVRPEENLGKLLWDMSMAEGISYMKEHYHLAQSEKEITQGVLDVIQHFYYEEAPLKTGVKSFLEEMRKAEIPMVVATSGDRKCLEAAFVRNGIADYFQKIFTCDEIGAGKTKPLIYKACADYLGQKAEEIVVFEDASYAIKTAKAANFQVVAMYDASGEAEFEEVKKIADFYMYDFTKKEIFFQFI